ncbi:hypothetical protein [Pseudomonas mosselii]|uniref:hypothetical protein n=1 Tax=Pseudomonas mosselii TaxID=78327 RepID=UPI0015863ACB|nr:hypothetical protein [Pseudomonas mosselii]
MISSQKSSSVWERTADTEAIKVTLLVPPENDVPEKTVFRARPTRPEPSEVFTNMDAYTKENLLDMIIGHYSAKALPLAFTQ